MRLLLAESHAALAEMVRLYFSKTGDLVHIAPAVEPCLTELAVWQPEALVLDWSLAGGGGRAVLERLLAAERSTPASSTRPLIVPTFTGALPRELSGPIGALITVWMLKPFALRELSAVLHEVTDTRRAAVQSLTVQPTSGLAAGPLPSAGICGAEC